VNITLYNLTKLELPHIVNFDAQINDGKKIEEGEHIPEYWRVEQLQDTIELNKA